MTEIELLKEHLMLLEETSRLSDEDTVAFFSEMEKKGLTIKTDTTTPVDELSYYLFDYWRTLGKTLEFLRTNNLNFKDYSQFISPEWKLSAEELFIELRKMTLFSRQRILKMSGCNQGIIDILMKMIAENDNEHFCDLLIKENVDLVDISTWLHFNSSMPELKHEEMENIEPIWHELKREMTEDILGNIYHAFCESDEVDAYSDKTCIEFSWLIGERISYKEMLTEGVVVSRMNDLRNNLKEKIENAVTDNEKKNVLIDLIKFNLKFLMVYLDIRKSSSLERKIIDSHLDQSYLKPLFDEIQEELNSITKNEKEYDGLENLFEYECDEDTSKHLKLDDKLLKDGSKKLFLNLLNGLVKCGYVEKSDDVVLAYRLSGFRKEDYGDKVIRWHKGTDETDTKNSEKILRYLIYQICKKDVRQAPNDMNKFFVNEDGEEFLKNITTSEAKNIRRLPIYRNYIKPIDQIIKD